MVRNASSLHVTFRELGEHELTADGRKNLQRLEKPRANRLTLKYPPASLPKPPPKSSSVFQDLSTSQTLSPV
jgi:hypothetical protein